MHRPPVLHVAALLLFTGELVLGGVVMAESVCDGPAEWGQPGGGGIVVVRWLHSPGASGLAVTLSLKVFSIRVYVSTPRRPFAAGGRSVRSEVQRCTYLPFAGHR